MKKWIINIILLTYLAEFACTIFIGIFVIVYAQKQYIDEETEKTRDCVLVYFLFVFGYFFIVLIAMIMLMVNILLARNIAHLRLGTGILSWTKISCFQELHIVKGWCIYTGTKFTLMCILVIFLSIQISTKIGWIFFILGVSEIVIWLLLRPLKLIQTIYSSEKLTQGYVDVEIQEHELPLNNVGTKVDIEELLQEGMDCDPM